MQERLPASGIFLRPTYLHGRTRLAHDTLAPLIRERFEQSDRPGNGHDAFWRAGPSTGNGMTGPVLDEADFAVVEKGATGMRVRTPDEVRLMIASREEANRRQAETERKQQALG